MLDELGEVHGAGKGILDGLEVHLVTVARELDPVHQAGGEIL